MPCKPREVYKHKPHKPHKPGAGRPRSTGTETESHHLAAGLQWCAQKFASLYEGAGGSEEEALQLLHRCLLAVFEFVLCVCVCVC